MELQLLDFLHPQNPQEHHKELRTSLLFVYLLLVSYYLLKLGLCIQVAYFLLLTYVISVMLEFNLFGFPYFSVKMYFMDLFLKL